MSESDVSLPETPNRDFDKEVTDATRIAFSNAKKLSDLAGEIERQASNLLNKSGEVTQSDLLDLSREFQALHALVSEGQSRTHAGAQSARLRADETKSSAPRHRPQGIRTVDIVGSF